MATLLTLMKRLTFTEQDRASVAFSDRTKIRLDPKLHQVTLRGTPGSYPTDDDIYIVSAAMSPQAVRSWVAFQAEVEQGMTRGETVVTSTKYRLHDGTNQWFWNGAAWEQGTSTWNAEAEIATNISSYIATATRTLRIVVNLKTTNKSYTPILRGLRLAYEANLRSEQEDLVYRTLLPAMSAAVRPVARFVTNGAGSSSIDLGAVLTATKMTYQIVGVDAVYNHTDDSGHLSDLLSSYNSTTQIITLSGSLASSKVAFIEATIEPELVFEATSPDFIELEKVPALVLTGLTPTGTHPTALRDSVTDKDAVDPTILVFPPPYRMTFLCDIIATAARGVDLQRLVEETTKFFEANRIMRTNGTDEPFGLRLVDEFRSTTVPTAEGLHSSQARFEIADLYFHTRGVLTDQDGVYPIQSVKLTGDAAVTIS